MRQKKPHYFKVNSLIKDISFLLTRKFILYFVKIKKPLKLVSNLYCYSFIHAFRLLT